MTEPITVYGRATSSNVQAVMWSLAELGLDCERLDYGHSHGGNDTPEYRAMNPTGLVPTLRHGDLVIWESAAICRYLAARFGPTPLWPADPAARAPVDMWAEWGKTTLGPHFSMPIFWPVIRTPAAERDDAAVAAAITRFDADLAMLEARIGAGPWIMGAELTLADIMAGTLFYRWFTMEIDRPARPGIEAYYARLCERPTYAEHVMVNYDSLRAPAG